MPRRSTVPDMPSLPTAFPPYASDVIDDVTEWKREQFLFLGADPGVSGAFIFVDIKGEVRYEIRMKETEKDIAEQLCAECPYVQFALIERVNAGFFSRSNVPGQVRKQGVKSAFTFGENYGMIHGMITFAGIRHEYVRPQDWQKVMNCRTKGDKNVSKAAAQRLQPDYKFVHATADAYLIAEMARRTAIERGIV